MLGEDYWRCPVRKVAVLMHKTREALRDGRLGIFLKTPNGSVFFGFGDTGHKIGLIRGLTKVAAIPQAVWYCLHLKINVSTNPTVVRSGNVRQDNLKVQT